MRCLLHLLALFWSQHFVQVKIVFHAIITRLLFDVAECRKLFFDGCFIPLPGLDDVNQRAVFNILHRNLAYVGFKLLVQFFNLRNLVSAQLKMLYYRIWAGAGTLDVVAASVLKEAPATVTASKVMRKKFFMSRS